jgi:hypothetical protein
MADIFAKVREAFFSSPKVLAAVEKKKINALKKFGAFVRRRARSSIRKSKKSALPGMPPKAHAGQLKLIFFSYDARSGSVVVGPIPFAAKGGSAIVPRLLEEGGAGARKTKNGTRATHYRGNPFMKPAMLAELPKFADLFRG